MAAVLMLVSLAACSINININNPTENTEVSDTQQPADATKAPTGSLSDYVRTLMENEVPNKNGETTVFRIPEILLDSEDAKAANSDIVKKYSVGISGDAGINKLDYTATLNDWLLSVSVSAAYEGGSVGGDAYCFDVTTGKKAGSDAICKYKGVSYTDVIDQIEKALDKYYKDHSFDKLPLNEDMKAKTFSAKNIKDARLYLNDKGKIMCIADVYASVGGGHFIVDTELDL